MSTDKSTLTQVPSQVSNHFAHLSSSSCRCVETPLSSIVSQSKHNLRTNGAQGSSSSGSMEALIKQILVGNNRIETKVDGLGTRVTAVERKTYDICNDSRQRCRTFVADTPLSLASLCSRHGCTRTSGLWLYDDNDCSTLQQRDRSPIISFTGFPPDSDKFEIKKGTSRNRYFRCSPKSTGREIDAEPCNLG